MKSPSFDIGDKVFLALVPGMYEGTSPGLDPTKLYIFQGCVGGLRWDNKLDEWLYEVYNPVGTFWTFWEYISMDQKGAVKAIAMTSESSRRIPK